MRMAAPAVTLVFSARGSRGRYLGIRMISWVFYEKFVSVLMIRDLWVLED